MGLGNPPAVRVRMAKNRSVQFHTRPKTLPAASWRGKPGPVPVNPRVLPGLARPVGSNLRFWCPGFSNYISKMYFSLREPPGVSERMWSVNLDASISGGYQTLGGHSGRPSE